MNYTKEKKPSRPDIQEILSRMKSRFINEEDSDNEDRIKEENIVTSIVESTVQEIPVEKSPDDEIAELMLKLNGQVDEELVASIRSRKKMYENQSEVDSTSSTTNNSDQTEQEKPRIILTLRPNENKPDSYVSSSNLTDFSGNSPKRKKQMNEVNTEVLPLKRSSRRSNDSNQSVLKSAIARKERTFSIDVSSKKILPKKIKKEPEEVNISPVEDVNIEIKNEVQFKEERSEECTIDQKKKKKKFFRGGRYNIFKKRPLQKERQKVVKKAVYNKLNSKSGIFDVDSSETNSERHSASVCSDVGTLMSSDRNYQDDLDISMSTTDMEDTVNDSGIDIQDIQEIHLCLCNEQIQVIIVDEGKISCKAEDCVDGKLILCKNLASQFDEYGHMPMLRANVTLPFLTFCTHHMKRFFLHHSCPRCGRFCTEGIFMMCKNKHFSHIGCHQKDRGCLHCGAADVYDLEIRRHIIKHRKKIQNNKCTSNITVQVGNVKLTTLDCPPGINEIELSKHLQYLQEIIDSSKPIMYSVIGLYQACESNDIKKVLSIIGSECNVSYTFPNYHNRIGLHAACSKGHLMLVYLLLQAGVDPNVVDEKMKTPMRMAAKFGHSNVIQCLMDFHGSPEIKDMQGMTALHLAAKNGNLECCKIILSKRPSMVNWKDNGGWTPLVWACENSHTDVVRFFITYKPNTRIPDDENNVALHWAAISECLGVVKCLVEYDSEVNMFNDAGDTALHIAARKNSIDIVSFLIEKGAMAWHKNKMKKRPIDCCLPNTKCFTILRNISPEQRKPVIHIQPLMLTINLDCDIKSELETTQTPVFIKTTPVLISEDITHGCEDVPIRCVNEIDDEVPVEFTYIKENCYDVGNYVDSAMSHIASCNCEGACNTNNCKCVQANGECLYDENGRLNSDFDYFNPSVILYECNLRCRCHKQRCGNRIIQKGIKVKLELYRHKDMGWGVRTRQAIPRGTFVCEYVGEIITDQKANDLKEDSYLFNLENPGATELYCIDAYNYSNVSRFINHSCDPNLMSVRSFINHHDKKFPRIAFFAVQDINENEQLSYDYGTTFWKIKGGLFTCKCGKSNCSFSEETIKSLHIDSDNEETELDANIEQSKTTENKHCDNELSFKDKNKTDIYSSQNKARLNKAKCNNLLEQKHKYVSPSSSESSSGTTKELMEKIPNNGLLTKNKINLSVKKKKPNKNVSKELLMIPNDQSTNILGSKLIQKKLKQVMLKKRMNDSDARMMLNGNYSLAVDKEMKITKNKSVGRTVKNNICNDNKVSSGSDKLNNNNKAYLLRPKGLNSNRKNNENIKTEGTIQNDTVLKLSDFRNNRSTSVSSNTSNCSQNPVQDSNGCDQVDCIKTEPVYEESDTKLIEGIRDPYSSECKETLYASESEYYKIKSGEILDINAIK